MKPKKSKKTSIMELSTVPFSFSVFKKDVCIYNAMKYSAIMLIALAILNVLKELNNYSNLGLLQSFIYTLIGLPIVALAIFGVFYLFLNSFEDKRKNFFEAFFVFTTISLPFLFVGHVLNWIRVGIGSSMLANIMTFLILVLMIYFVVNIVINFKRYYGTTAIRVITSFMLVDMLFLFLAIVQYMTYLMSLTV